MSNSITVEEARALLKRKKEEAAIRFARESEAQKERELAQAKAQMDDAIVEIDKAILDAIQHCQSETKYHSYDEPLNSLLVDHYKRKGFKVTTEFDDYEQQNFTHIGWAEGNGW